ncbi:hypothetical protein [Ottowia sp. VDI28]|uniref:hypothetical protein n=1 Tax=Ottowia sp. VDI28 TaxID=3133968 RepID=UPI003C2FC7A9
MDSDKLLFELLGPDGEVWRLYLDGRTEGFPQGTVMQNFAFPLWCTLVGNGRKENAQLMERARMLVQVSRNLNLPIISDGPPDALDVAIAIAQKELQSSSES